MTTASRSARPIYWRRTPARASFISRSRSMSSVKTVAGCSFNSAAPGKCSGRSSGPTPVAAIRERTKQRSKPDKGDCARNWESSAISSSGRSSSIAPKIHRAAASSTSTTFALLESAQPIRRRTRRKSRRGSGSKWKRFSARCACALTNLHHGCTWACRTCSNGSTLLDRDHRPEEKIAARARHHRHRGVASFRIEILSRCEAARRHFFLGRR